MLILLEKPSRVSSGSGELYIDRPYYLKKVKELSEGLKIISPGVGAQGGDIVNAMLLGSDYVIIGRSIYNSLDPLGTLEGFSSSINNKLNK